MNTDRLNEIDALRLRLIAADDDLDDLAAKAIKELLDEVDRLRDGLRKFLDGNYPQAERPYQCQHGLYWYDTCATCIDDYLFRLLGGES